MRARSLSLFGGTRWHEFPASSVGEPTGYHPLASFKVRKQQLFAGAVARVPCALWVVRQRCRPGACWHCSCMRCDTTRVCAVHHAKHRNSILLMLQLIRCVRYILADSTSNQTYLDRSVLMHAAMDPEP